MAPAKPVVVRMTYRQSLKYAIDASLQDLEPVQQLAEDFKDVHFLDGGAEPGESRVQIRVQ